MAGIVKIYPAPEVANRKIRTKITKTKSGKIVKKLEEIYIRDDISCGISSCAVCANLNDDTFRRATLLCPTEKRILIFDAQTSLRQIDFISDESAVTNVVIPISVLKWLEGRDRQTYNRLRALCRQNDKAFYVFDNDVFSETFEEQRPEESGYEHLKREIFKLYRFYTHHIETSLGSSQCILLVNSQTAKREAQEQDLEVLTVHEFADEMRTYFPTCGQTLADPIEEEEGDWEEKRKKSIFPQHLPETLMRARLAQGTLFKGTLRMFDYQRGYILPNNNMAEERIFLSGDDLNRAVMGDLVAVEILAEDESEGDISDECEGIEIESEDVESEGMGGKPREGKNKSEKVVNNSVKIEKKSVKIEKKWGKIEKKWGKIEKKWGEIEKKSEPIHKKSHNNSDEIPKKIKKIEPNLDTPLNNGEQIESEEQAILDENIDQQKRGKIVGIIKRNWGEYYGSLKPTDSPKSKMGGKQTRWFIPMDNRIPWIKISTKQGDDMEGMRISVVIDHWSRFHPKPFGHYTGTIGKAQDKFVESDVILKSYNIDSRQFSEAVIRCLPPSDWKISAREIEKRVDLRAETICSIDPPGCKDIDDALGAKLLPNGNFQIGVHIADVTHFVLPDTAIDIEAAERCTTVYLVERRTDMLPGLLTTELCSLVGEQERLAFSVMWEMTTEGKVINTKFFKSVIRSAAALSYKEAQLRIDNNDDQTEVTKSIRILREVAMKLRAARMAQGALELASEEVRFELDSETQDPMEVCKYEARETNKLVEEFMLLANISVARYILQNFPSSALLRRHPPPKQDRLEEIKDLLAQRGFNDFKYGTSKELSESLSKLVVPDDPYFNTLLRIKVTRCMEKAQYFCSGIRLGSEATYYHYGLATEFYTHFTSPIRRYADVMVHRLLAASLGLVALPPKSSKKEAVEQICERINEKHWSAQMAGRASVALHCFLYVKKKKFILTDALVLRIAPESVVLYAPHFALEGVAKVEEGFEVKEKIGDSLVTVTQERVKNVKNNRKRGKNGEEPRKTDEKSKGRNSAENNAKNINAKNINDKNINDIINSSKKKDKKYESDYVLFHSEKQDLIGIFEHVIVRIETNEEDMRNRLKFTILRKAKPCDIEEQQISPQAKFQIQEEMFPDRIEQPEE